jgi:hypothetical protein
MLSVPMALLARAGPGPLCGATADRTHGVKPVANQNGFGNH